MIQLASDRLQLSLHEPEDGFYLGTRFDHSGVFGSLLFDGVEMAGPWFEKYSPTLHDAVQGPAEEFSAIGYDAPGTYFLKPGVGLLKKDGDAPYDRFHLYERADAGAWEVVCRRDWASFRHRLAGWYDYHKEIVLTGPSGLEIRHRLQAEEQPLEGTVYNHNFWTFGNLSTGPARVMDFPFRPGGHWRSAYGSVALTEGGIRFSRILGAGESVFMGDLQEAGASGLPYEMSIGEGPLTVRIRGDVPLTHLVFWANHRIACLEPYSRYALAPGQTFEWTVNYQFDSC